METHNTNSSYEKNDIWSSFLKDNSWKKKTYAEATKEAFMQDTDDGAGAGV